MKIRCEKCRQKYEVDESYFGHLITCFCGNEILVVSSQKIQVLDHIIPETEYELKKNDANGELVGNSTHDMIEKINEEKESTPTQTVINRRFPFIYFTAGRRFSISLIAIGVIFALVLILSLNRSRASNVNSASNGKNHQESLNSPASSANTPSYSNPASTTETQSTGQNIEQGITQDEKGEQGKVFQSFMAKANDGNAEAQYFIGSCYYLGQGGITQNHKLAAEWFTKSANQNYFKAQYFLGLMYYKGDGVEKDYKKAFDFFEKSANNGNAESQFWIARCYECGEGTVRDYKQAVYWYTKSASQGYSLAQCNLAWLYYYGEGVGQDYKKAFELFTKTVNDGDEYAQYAQYGLGVCYYRGHGVEKNYTKAKEWLSNAAKRENMKAQKFLDLIRKKEQPAPKSINWTIQNENSVEVECHYSAGNVRVRVCYWRSDQRIGNLFIDLKDVKYPGKARDEIEGRFKNISELNSFLLRCHNEFFYIIDEDELVDVIRMYSPPRKTVTF